MNILSRQELEKTLSFSYPDKSTKRTNRNRSHNINTLVNFILSDINANSLSFGKKERRIHLYTTSKGEKIHLQYPGMYSRNGKLLYDFRPVAELPNGSICIDMNFEFIWRIIGKYIDGHKNLMALINSLLFRMGRMYDYKYSSQTYYNTYLIENGVCRKSNDINIPLYRLDFDNDDLINSLNLYGEDIDAGKGNTMSLEAFLYYFELLLQIEDCKYNYKKCSENKKPDAAGRISSSDSLIVVSSFSNGAIDLANILMRFVHGKGIARCEIEEYPNVTGNIVSIIKYKNHFKDLAHDNGFLCNGQSLKFKKTAIPVDYQFPEKKIAITEEPLNEENQALIKENGWQIYDLETFFKQGSLSVLDQLIVNAPIIPVG